MSMTVAELIEQLQGQDPDLPVMLQILNGPFHIEEDELRQMHTEWKTYGIMLPPERQQRVEYLVLQGGMSI